jgi:hypothetical protein
MRKLFLILAIGLMAYAISWGDFSGNDTADYRVGGGHSPVPIYDGNNPRTVPFVAAYSGTVDSIWIYAVTRTSDRTVRLALYQYSNRALICSTRVTIASACTTFAAGVAAPASQSITQGVKYFVAPMGVGSDSILTYRYDGDDSLKGIEYSSSAWPGTITLSDVGGQSFAFVAGISTSAGGAPEQPDSLTSVVFDSLYNDFAADSDSVVVVITCPAQSGDSVKFRYAAGSSYPIFSTGTLIQYDYPTGGGTITDTIIVVATESYTLRGRAWAFIDGASPETSLSVKDSIYFSAGTGGTVDLGEKNRIFNA